jgi:hypothetical protein
MRPTLFPNKWSLQMTKDRYIRLCLTDILSALLPAEKAGPAPVQYNGDNIYPGVAYERAFNIIAVLNGEMDDRLH